MKKSFYISLFTISSFLNALDISQIKNLEHNKNYFQVLKLSEENLNQVYSLFILADYLFHGRKDIAQAQAKGKEYYQKAIPLLLLLANDGNADAQYYLGRCYEYGNNDNTSARKWYIKAADNGNSDAMVKAAMFIAKRKGGGEKDPARVMQYIQKAIVTGNYDGTALLSSYYLEGRKDIKKGIQLAKEASDAGSPLGQMLMGSIYMQGMGTIARDENKAIELLQASSDQGNSMVNEMLAQLKNKKQTKQVSAGQENKSK